MKYKEVDISDISIHTLRLAEQVRDRVTSLLEIYPIPVLKFFEPLAGQPECEEPLNFRQQPYSGNPNIYGVATQDKNDNRTIFVRNGLSDIETIRSVSHECWHCYEYQNVIKSSEPDAEAFAERILSEYLNEKQPRYGWQEITDQYGFSRWIYRPPG